MALELKRADEMYNFSETHNPRPNIVDKSGQQGHRGANRSIHGTIIPPEMPLDDRSPPRKINKPSYEAIIDQICDMPWLMISNRELLITAHMYYYFSIQFRENLEIACALYPRDENLKTLHKEECHTDNLSPWPGVAGIGEKLNHDEFMRRLLSLQPIDRADHLRRVGASYLAAVRRVDPLTRAKSIASYEDGGLSRVFLAILRAPCWEGAALQAFRFFLEQHVLFDSASEQGHGALCRHLVPDDSILPLWAAFQGMLTIVLPWLAGARPEPGRMVAGRDALP